MTKISKAPMRISFIGGGSDLPAYWKNYAPCRIISTTIDKYIIVTYHIKDINPEKEPPFIYSSFNIYKAGNLVVNPYVQTFFNHVFDNNEIKQHIIQIHSDTVPSGSGLGASSALSVALAQLISLRGRKNYVAKLAIKMELDEIGMRIGWQDHLASTYGGVNLYEIPANGDYTIETIACEYLDLSNHLLVFRIDGAKHIAQDTLVTMNKEMEHRAKYIAETDKLVPDMRESLEDNDMMEFGRILDECWKLKLLSHGIKTHILSDLVELGFKCGAYGGKVSGSLSGCAGHLVFIAPPDKHGYIAQRLTETGIVYRVPVGITLKGVDSWGI